MTTVRPVQVHSTSGREMPVEKISNLLSLALEHVTFSFAPVVEMLVIERQDQLFIYVDVVDQADVTFQWASRTEAKLPEDDAGWDALARKVVRDVRQEIGR